MTTPEAMGHVAVITLAGVCGVMWGFKGTLLGVVIFIAWLLLAKKKKTM